MLKRKTYSKRADVPPDVLRALNTGADEARTLAEILSVDLAVLLKSAAPDLSPSAYRKMSKAAEEGWLTRTKLAGEIILEHHGMKALPHLMAHASDQVRGWAAVMIGQQEQWTLKKCLEAMKPLADDPNPGTRETAWIMLRPRIAADLETSFSLLQDWAESPRDNIRRYAIEITRPRGVWCAHIRSLRDDPAAGLPLLSACHADPSRYVQNSVANWLNDAAKDHPQWVRQVTKDFLKKNDGQATQYICKRALRSL